MDKKPMYFPMNLHVPERSHEKLMKAVTRKGAVSVKLDLTGTPKDKLYVTSGQRRKIEEAVAKDRRDMTLRFSQRQARHNIKSEGGFLAGMLAAAARILPSILAGLLAGSAESQSEGNGMFLGKRDHTYQIKHTGEGILITPAEHKKTVGFYVKHGDKVYQGKGLLHRLFGQIPLLNIFNGFFKVY